MNENRVKRNRLLGDRVIRGLESRNMEGYYAETKEEALKKALELIPEGSSLSWGGSMTIAEIGLKEAVCSGNYKVYNRDAAKNPEEKRAAEPDQRQCGYRRRRDDQCGWLCKPGVCNCGGAQDGIGDRGDE